jgi:isopentenyl-diphosphate delta-isomerase
MLENIILVNEKDVEIGTGEKLSVHHAGLLHRAFSIYIFNDKSELLLQQRAKKKYHSGGLWTNSCCGHPRAGEDTKPAAHRRLFEEFGFNCELEEITPFRYEVDFKNGLKENEFLHLFVGRSSAIPAPNPEEVEDWKWACVEDVAKDIKNRPELYTYWFKLIMQNPEKLKELTEKNNSGKF